MYEYLAPSALRLAEGKGEENDKIQVNAVFS